MIHKLLIVVSLSLLNLGVAFAGTNNATCTELGLDTSHDISAAIFLNRISPNEIEITYADQKAGTLSKTPIVVHPSMFNGLAFRQYSGTVFSPQGSFRTGGNQDIYISRDDLNQALVIRAHFSAFEGRSFTYYKCSATN